MNLAEGNAFDRLMESQGAQLGGKRRKARKSKSKSKSAGKKQRGGNVTAQLGGKRGKKSRSSKSKSSSKGKRAAKKTGKK